MVLELTSIFYIIKRKVNFYRERMWQKTAGIPSTACLDAWTDYYSDSHMVDINVAFFKDMVKNWGTPDWSNPYPPATKEYYKIHPQGFIMWDIERILTPIASPGTVKEDCFDEIGTELSIEKSEEKGVRRYIRENNIRNACVDCIAVLLGENCSIERTASILNEKDLKAIIAEVVIYGDYKSLNYNTKNLLKNAYKQNLIDKDEIAKLYAARMSVNIKDREEIDRAPLPDKYNPELPKLNLNKV